MKQYNKQIRKHFPTFLQYHPRTRMTAIVALGVMMLGVTWYWRTEYMQASEYVDFPIRYSTLDTARGEMRSSNYILETEEISPAAR